MTEEKYTVNDDNTENIENAVDNEFNEDIEIEDYDNEETEYTDNGTDSEVERLKEELAKKEKAFQDQKRRAELAEKKRQEKAKNKTSGDNLSQRDIIAVVRNNIEDVDLDTVQEFAKGTGVSVAEAIANPTLKAILRDKAEERKTASVSNSGRQRGGQSQKNIEVIRDNVKRGKMPEGEDLDRFLRDRYSVK